ncbi:glycosyltransferase [Burkholderia pseudomultivorans]|uniref:glycosyltransferase n=1 Tax=Burkholderia pseudomultivorans TaxID=1207504 RepID=UPI0018C88945|nr:glycosyltransferase [Burkholderia pseudomultivorans]
MPNTDDDRWPISPASLWWPDRMIPSTWLVHAPFAFWLIDAARPTCVVDWNRQDGASGAVWCQAISRLGLTARCFMFVDDKLDTGAQSMIDDNVLLYGAFSTIARSSLDDACASVTDGSVDLLHLDCTRGDADVCRAFEAWLPKMSEHGIVLLHGTRLGGEHGVVHERWRALRDRYESFEFPHGDGLGVLSTGEVRSVKLRRLFQSGVQAVAIASLYERLGMIVSARDEVRVDSTKAVGEAGALRDARVVDADAIARLTGTIDRQRERLEALKRRLQHETRTAYLANEQLRQARTELGAIRGSTSWRITRPMRSVVGGLSGPRRIVSKMKSLSSIVGVSVQTRGWQATLRKIAGARKQQGWRALLGAGAGARSMPQFALPAARPALGNLALRVLIVAEMSIPQCLKYRVTQKQRMIEALGVDCTVVSWTDAANARSLMQTHSVAIFYRVPGFPPQLELIDEAKKLGVRTYWEVDDLIFDAEKYLRNANLDKVDVETRKGVLAGVPLYRAAMLACDAAIASTTGLAHAMREAGVTEVHVIENALDEETLRLADAVASTPKIDDGVVRIAYGSGTKTHDADFRVAAPALKRVLAARPNVRLRIIGELNLPPDFDEIAGQIERLPLSNYATYLKRLAESDISIAPLEDNIFNDAKSNIKYLEAASIGLPSVCSPAAAFRTAIQDGNTGWLASDSAAWERALLSLIDDPALRKAMAHRALRHVHADYAPDAVAKYQVLPMLSTLARPARKLRVLAVNIYFEPRSFGGATVVAEEIARRLNASGVLEYWMFTSMPVSDVPAYQLTRYDSSAGGVFAMGLPDESDPMFGFDNPHAVEPFRETLRAVRPDVVHLHSIQGIGARIAEVCQDEDIPYVVTLHDAWWICGRQFMITGENRFCNQRKIDVNVCATCVENPALNGYRQMRLREILEGAAMLLVPSEYFRQLFVENGFDSARVVLNKNGVMAPRQIANRKVLAGRKLRFGYVGGDTPIKGANLIREAFNRMPHTDYQLRVVDNVLNLGRHSIDPIEWSIPGELEIVPAFNQQTIDSFFSEIDVLLCPTQCMESFGLSVREALVRNVWVVATEAGGLSEDIVPGENGDVIPLDGTSRELERVIRRLLDDPSQLDGYRNRLAGDIRLFDEQAAELGRLLTDLKAGGADTSSAPIHWLGA